MTYVRCPNCGEYPALCLCTWAEIQRAAQIRRQKDRAKRRERGEPVLVDYSDD